MTVVETVLELDQGNTRGKWRLVRSTDRGDVDIIARGAFAPGPWWQGEPLPGSWLRDKPAAIRCANVAGKPVADAIAARLQNDFGLPVAFARVTPRSAGVQCAYADVSRLGVDRWLAVLAAYGRDRSPALVVDCGSAVTLDLLGRDGQHLGGYIVPGLGLMRRALYSDTDAVKVAASFAEGMSLAPGRSTEEAVNRGLPLMVLGAIERARAELVQHLPDAPPGSQEGETASPRLLFTGGDGALMASLYHRASEVVEDLVMEGLAYAALSDRR